MLTWQQCPPAPPPLPYSSGALMLPEETFIEYSGKPGTQRAAVSGSLGILQVPPLQLTPSPVLTAGGVVVHSIADASGSNISAGWRAAGPQCHPQAHSKMPSRSPRLETTTAPGNLLRSLRPGPTWTQLDSQWGNSWCQLRYLDHQSV